MQMCARPYVCSCDSPSLSISLLVYYFPVMFTQVQMLLSRPQVLLRVEFYILFMDLCMFSNMPQGIFYDLKQCLPVSGEYLYLPSPECRFCQSECLFPVICRAQFIKTATQCFKKQDIANFNLWSLMFKNCLSCCECIFHCYFILTCQVKYL